MSKGNRVGALGSVLTSFSFFFFSFSSFPLVTGFVSIGAFLNAPTIGGASVGAGATAGAEGLNEGFHLAFSNVFFGLFSRGFAGAASSSFFGRG
jgi:hypothetical protein